MKKLSPSSKMVLDLLREHPNGITSKEITVRLKAGMSTVSHALTMMIDAGLASKKYVGPNRPCIWFSTSWPEDYTPPPPKEPETSIALPIRPITSTAQQKWPSMASVRSGADDHKKHGSLQADGSVKPYSGPSAMCVGELNDRSSHTRD